jgi:hypothetical protein
MVTNRLDPSIGRQQHVGRKAEGNTKMGRSRRRIQQSSNRDKEGEISYGKSDASYHKRLHFQSLAAAGLSADSTLADGGANAGSKFILPASGKWRQKRRVRKPGNLMVFCAFCFQNPNPATENTLSLKLVLETILSDCMEGWTCLYSLRVNISLVEPPF